MTASPSLARHREGSPIAIRIRCFPSADRAFFDAVHAAAASVTTSQVATPEAVSAVESTLRDQYPDVRISIRSGLAVLWADEPQWYAYRDGRPDARGPGAAIRRGRGAISRAIRAAARRDPLRNVEAGAAGSTAAASTTPRRRE